jgi:hypothetical protein
MCKIQNTFASPCQQKRSVFDSIHYLHRRLCSVLIGDTADGTPIRSERNILARHNFYT